MTGKFREGSQYQASSVGIAKYLNRARWCQIGENTEKLQLNTINLAKLPGLVRGVEPREWAQRDQRLQIVDKHKPP